VYKVSIFFSSENLQN